MNFLDNELLEKARNKATAYNGGLIYTEIYQDTDDGVPGFKIEGSIEMPTGEFFITVLANLLNVYLTNTSTNEDEALKMLFEAMMNLREE